MMIKKTLRILYSEKVNTLVLMLSILPFFTINWNYGLQVYIVFFVYFLFDFMHNVKIKSYQGNKILFLTDFLSLLSLIPEIRIFVLFRFFRFFRIFLRLRGIKFIVGIYKNNWLVIKSLLYVSLAYMICVSLILFNLEPESFDNQYLNALYWSGITLTTVGYGDFYPVTMLGKFFALIASFIGIAIVALPTGFVASEFLNRINELSARNKNKD